MVSTLPDIFFGPLMPFNTPSCVAGKTENHPNLPAV